MTSELVKVSSVALVLLVGCRALPPRGAVLGETTSSSAAVPATASPKPLLQPENRIDLQLTIAESLERQKQYEAAAKLYEGILQLDPKSATASHRLAVLHDQLGRGDASTALFQKALALTPSDAGLHCDFGYSCYLRGEIGLAEEHLMKAVQLMPDFRRAHVNLGMLLARTGRGDAALQEFAKAGLSEAAARNNLAFALSLDNHLPEAASQYSLALQVDSKLAQAQQGSKDVQRVIEQLRSPTLQ